MPRSASTSACTLTTSRARAAHARMLAAVGVHHRQPSATPSWAAWTQIAAEIEAGSFELQDRARGHPLQHRAAPDRADRRARAAPAHRALAQRPGGDRLPALGARRHGPRRRAAAPSCSACCSAGARACRHGDAGLHPSPGGAAGHLRPSSAGLCRDAGPRPLALRRRAPAARTNARWVPPRWPARASRSTGR